jgi:hypothetical protein
MSNDDGQRIEKRVTINKEFESFDAFVHEYVTNVSRSGVFIRSKEPLPIGTEVDLTGRRVHQADNVLRRLARSVTNSLKR